MTTTKFGSAAAARWSEEAYADVCAYLGHRSELVRALGPPLVSGDRVLDLACGDGGFAEFLLPYGLSYLGVDSSDAMVGAARARLGSRADVVVGDLNRYSPPMHVAATIVFRALYYVHDRTAFFRRVAGFTEKKLVFDLNPRRFQLAEIRSELESAGFHRLDVHPFFVPQRFALPRPAIDLLLAAERAGPAARALLRFRFSYVCAGWRN